MFLLDFLLDLLDVTLIAGGLLMNVFIVDIYGVHLVRRGIGLDGGCRADDEENWPERGPK